MLEHRKLKLLATALSGEGVYDDVKLLRCLGSRADLNSASQSPYQLRGSCVLKADCCLLSRLLSSVLHRDVQMLVCCRFWVKWSRVPGKDTA